MDSKLNELLDNRPNAIGNTFVIVVIRFISGLMGTALFIVGVSILIHNLVYDEFLAQFNVVEDLDNRTMNIIGSVAFIVGILFFGVVRLCSMLIKRNLFLLELDEWRYNWEVNEKELKNKNDGFDQK